MVSTYILFRTYLPIARPVRVQKMGYEPYYVRLSIRDSHQHCCQRFHISYTIYLSTSALPRQQTWLPCVPRYLLGSMLDRRQRRPYYVHGRLAISHVWFQAWHKHRSIHDRSKKARRNVLIPSWWRWSSSIVSTISFCRKRYSLGSWLGPDFVHETRNTATGQPLFSRYFCAQLGVDDFVPQLNWNTSTGNTASSRQLKHIEFLCINF